MTENIIALLIFGSTIISNPMLVSPIGETLMVKNQTQEALSSVSLDLETRYENDFVNEVFKDNILLALYYLKGEQIVKNPDWEKVRKPFELSFELKPGEMLAFHENILTEYKGKVVKTMDSRFMSDEGYRSSGFLVGDGVCHLASLMNWAASEASLNVISKVNHNFRLIPGIDEKYGTSIRFSQTGNNSQNQNLYIENNLDQPIIFKFKIDEKTLSLEIIKN